MSAMSVLISAGAVLGKANLAQLVVMTLIEVTTFGALRMVGRKFLNISSERKNAIFNTYYALAVSTVTAISVSALVNHHGKIDMTHIHNAVLAGGVVVSASGHLISSPWLAMVLGLMAGLLSIWGAKCLPVCFNQVLGIHDTGGVHYTFGLPGLLGGTAYIVLMALRVSWTNNLMCVSG
ncbi:hypothetical protein MC885_012081 [Smutsia gigantea]|nr:hypothetical protein MC885_012081 [Smutsia gigantea]